jgi:hypothetical protein
MSQQDLAGVWRLDNANLDYSKIEGSQSYIKESLDRVNAFKSAGMLLSLQPDSTFTDIIGGSNSQGRWLYVPHKKVVQLQYSGVDSNPLELTAVRHWAGTLNAKVVVEGMPLRLLFIKQRHKGD